MQYQKKLWLAGLLAFALSACGGLSAKEEKFAEVPAGTGLTVRLEKGVNTQSTHPGQPLTASVLEPVVLAGQTVIPAGATVSGTITAISERPPSVTVQFESVETPAGTLALGARPTVARLARHSEMRDEGAKIGGGAAAGALIGGVVGGNVKSAAIGAAAGAAAGTGVAMATKAHWAYLPAGAKVSLQLDESLHVPLPEEAPAAE